MRKSSTHKKYGPWAVITGASDGIGREFARLLAGEGFNLFIVARRKDRLDPLAKELMSKNPITVRPLALDLAQPASTLALYQEATSQDVGLFIAAAGYGTSGLFHRSDLENELSMIDLNVRAVVHQTRLFSEYFVSKKRGGIILMSSLVAFQGVPNSANYSGTKGFIQNFAEGIRQELMPHHVDVLASAPGPVLTGFGTRAQMRMTSGENPTTVARDTLKALGQKTTVRPGWLAKILEFSLKFLPRNGRVLVMQKVMGSMTRKDHSE